MEKQGLLYEGKAKRLYNTEDANLLISEFKDDLTAGNAAKKGSEEGKGALNNKISTELFKLLEYKKDSYEVEFESSSYLIKASSHEDKVMFSATDITEQKRKENLATMGQMAAHLSHEIRNPIGSIALLSSTLKKRVIAKNIPIVEEIQKSVCRIERIIKATLMFSKGVSANMKVFMWSELEKELPTK